MGSENHAGPKYIPIKGVKRRGLVTALDSVGCTILRRMNGLIQCPDLKNDIMKEIDENRSKEAYESQSNDTLAIIQKFATDILEKEPSHVSAAILGEEVFYMATHGSFLYLDLSWTYGCAYEIWNVLIIYFDESRE